MNKKNFSTLIAIAATSLAIFACGVNSVPVPAAPANTEEVEAPLSPTQELPVFSPTESPTEPTSPAPAIPETRRLILEYPPKMRAGVEGDIVILKLEVDEFGNITPTAQMEGNVIVGETVEIPNLYVTHNVTAEARLDLAGMQVSPANAIIEPLKPGQSATFYWSIRPQDAGTYRGTVWLHLNFEDKSTGEKSRIALSAQVVEIEAVDFFGLSVNMARTSGVLGSIIGGVIGFPFLEDILKFLFKKRKKQ